MPDAIGKQITLDNKTVVRFVSKGAGVVVDDIILNQQLHIPTHDLVKDGIDGGVGGKLHNTYIYEY